MATTMFFQEAVKDQCGRTMVDLEIGSSSYYPEPSIYIIVDGKTVIMDRKTAKRFSEAVDSLSSSLGLDDW